MSDFDKNKVGDMGKEKRIKIHMFPAGGGDCFLLEFLSEEFRMIIDGGYADTYYKYLRPMLKKLALDGKRINLLVVTHIDNDHINGIKALLEENGDAGNPKVIGVDEVWYNGFFHMNTKKVQSGEIPYYLEESMQSMVLANHEMNTNGIEEIGVSQGNTLAKLLSDGGYHWNSMFSNHAVCTEFHEHLLFGENIKLTLLNPGRQQLKNLANYWICELKKTIRTFIICEDRLYADAFESYMQWEEDDSDTIIEDICYNTDNSSWNELVDLLEDVVDSSKTNRSSIAFMIEYQGLRLLFPGDCPIQLLMEKLPHQIDFVKLPHHGSNKDVNKDFIRNTEVSFYLVSTDGKRHAHPAKSVIANILCKAIGKPMILKNYEIPFMKEVGRLVGYDDEGLYY